MSLETPVVILIYNRPDLTEKVFDSISKAKPKKLLVVADGPRSTEDVDKCKHARAVIDKVDWDCEVLKNYSEVNLGCRKRVSSGLDWVFSEVEEAIILEDDCLPAESFFKYCEELLEKYRYDERVMHISGNNFQDGISRTKYSYYFSKYSHIWGWASWRRAWQYYDVDMKAWPEIKNQGLVTANCYDKYEQIYWTDIFDQSYNGFIDTWDYQWLYTCWSQNGLSILPNHNLVSNIGFRGDGVNCKGASKYANMTASDIWTIKHPPSTTLDKEADQHTYDNHYNGIKLKESNLIFKRFYSMLKANIRKYKKCLN